MGGVEKVLLQGLLGEGLSLEQIGKRVGKHPSTIGYWLKQHGLEPVHRADIAARGPLSRDELELLVEQGHSVREIAELVDRSYTTVRHWLRAYGLKTLRARTRNERPRSVERRCQTHGMTLFVQTGSAGYYRCLRCRSDAVKKRRRKVKEIVVREAGGRCQLCGYDSCVAALEFHHVDPSTKLFTVAAGGLTRSLMKVRAEAKKCVLLCANCHAEVESGVASLP
jgi:transposase